MRIFGRRRDDTTETSNLPAGEGDTVPKVDPSKGNLKQSRPRPWDNPYAQAKLLEERNEWLEARHKRDRRAVVAVVAVGLAAMLGWGLMGAWLFKGLSPL